MSDDNENVGFDTIIFDVDGTLSNPSHRRHLVTGGNTDWPTFTDEMVNDTPHRDVCLLADLLGDHPLVNQGAVKLFAFTARPETHRKETEEWLGLYAHLFLEKVEGMLMRAAGDNRPDDVVKEEMLDAIIAKGYNVRFVVDDRPEVCEMWKRRGITLLRHDIGEWDLGAGVDCPAGHLSMMIGPAGAGKSRFAEHKFFGPAWKNDFAWPRSAYISTDALRQEFTGDFRDQSMNEAAFSAFHLLIKARVTAGLNTVADATFLHAKDRRAVRNLCPANTSIHYYVVDRPLEEKHASAGWRDEVLIEGVKLVDKHHHSFMATRAMILRGDDDPRVMVHDYTC